MKIDNNNNKNYKINYDLIVCGIGIERRSNKFKESFKETQFLSNCFKFYLIFLDQYPIQKSHRAKEQQTVTNRKINTFIHGFNSIFIFHIKDCTFSFQFRVFRCRRSFFIGSC